MTRRFLGAVCTALLLMSCGNNNGETTSYPAGQGGASGTTTPPQGGAELQTSGSVTKATGGAATSTATATSALGGSSSVTSAAIGGKSSATTAAAGGAVASGGTKSGTATSSASNGGATATASGSGGTSASSATLARGGSAGAGLGGSSQGGASGATTASSSAASGTPVDQHGQLKVVGTKLVDKDANPVQLKGPSSMWLNWESQKFAEDKQGLKVMRDDWKASLVRAAMGVDTTSKTDSDYVTAPDVAKAQVNQIVQNAIDLGMYVIIDWHYDKAETRQDLAVAFFTEMATKWGAYPNVIYETYNEPLTKDWAVVKPYHQAVVAAIRAVDPDNLIILGTPNYSQFVDLAAADPVTGTNLMYTLHFYSCTHTQKLRDTGTAALAKGLPLFVTEWGATNADGGTTKNPQLCLDEAQLWHDWMRDNKISWAAWKWDRCVDKTCYFNSTMTIPTTGPWTDDMLSGHTPFVRDRMRE